MHASDAAVVAKTISFTALNQCAPPTTRRCRRVEASPSCRPPPDSRILSPRPLSSSSSFEPLHCRADTTHGLSRYPRSWRPAVRSLGRRGTDSSVATTSTPRSNANDGAPVPVRREPFPFSSHMTSIRAGGSRRRAGSRGSLPPRRRRVEWNDLRDSNDLRGIGSTLAVIAVAAPAAAAYAARASRAPVSPPSRRALSRRASGFVGECSPNAPPPPPLAVSRLSARARPRTGSTVPLVLRLAATPPFRSPRRRQRVRPSVRPRGRSIGRRFVRLWLFVRRTPRVGGSQPRRPPEPGAEAVDQPLASSAG